MKNLRSSFWIIYLLPPEDDTFQVSTCDLGTAFRLQIHTGVGKRLLHKWDAVERSLSPSCMSVGTMGDLQTFCLGTYFLWISRQYGSLGSMVYLACGLPGNLNCKLTQCSLCSNDILGIVLAAGSIKRSTPQFWPSVLLLTFTKVGPGGRGCRISEELILQLAKRAENGLKERQSLKLLKVMNIGLWYLSLDTYPCVDYLCKESPDYSWLVYYFHTIEVLTFEWNRKKKSHYVFKY